MALFKAIIINEVPAALFCGVLNARTNTGIARKPPPIPKNPVSDPITNESSTNVAKGIFFSGAFCSIFWLKSRGIMQGLCNANSLIFKDENLHCDFAIHLLNNHCENKPSEKRIREILLSALEIEKEFITESLPVSLIGMNSNLMKQYLEFVVDGLLLKFGCSKEFNVSQPFKFMEQIAVETKGNFFESRTMEYQKAKLNETITFTDDF